VVEAKTLDIILSKIEELNNKFDGLDSKVNSLDSKMDGLDSRVNNLEDNLSGFRNEFNDFRDKTDNTLERIEHRADATFEQVGMLSEFRIDILSGIDALKGDSN